MKNYKISLVICAYNEEKYIGDCLDYAIKNSNGNFFEIIVIDNASTDNTKSEALKRAGVKVVREDQKGLTKARQRGFMEAKGDILAYIDADTRIPEGWMDRLINAFEKNDEVVLVSGPYIYHDISKFQQFLVKMYWYIQLYCLVIEPLIKVTFGKTSLDQVIKRAFRVKAFQLSFWAANFKSIGSSKLKV